MNEGVFIVRLVAGLLMAAHGSQKLFGWFGGYGIAGTGGFFESLGFRPGRLFAAAAGASEFFGGLLVAAGFLGPIGPALVVAVMIVAVATVHVKHGVFAATNGIELPVLYAAFAAGLAIAGPGRYSVDALVGLTAFSTPELGWAALGVAVAGAAANLLARGSMPVEV